MALACDYTKWREVTEYEPEPNRLVLIGTKHAYPVVGVRKQYERDGVEFFTNEFHIPASGNRIRSLEKRPIFWLPIEGC